MLGVTAVSGGRLLVDEKVNVQSFAYFLLESKCLEVAPALCFIKLARDAQGLSMLHPYR